MTILHVSVIRHLPLGSAYTVFGIDQRSLFIVTSFLVCFTKHKLTYSLICGFSIIFFNDLVPVLLLEMPLC